MENYVILTDSSCDLPAEYLAKRGIALANLTYRFEGEEAEYKVGDMPITDFYNLMRSGKVAKTSALNTETLYQFFASYLKEGRDVLYIAFSSGPPVPPWVRACWCGTPASSGMPACTWTSWPPGWKNINITLPTGSPWTIWCI